VGQGSRAQCKAVGDHVEVKKLTGEYIKPTLGRVTVHELSADWLAARSSPVPKVITAHWKRPIVYIFSRVGVR
jgi:hypothetical protein